MNKEKIIRFLKDYTIGRDPITNAEDPELRELLELTSLHQIVDFDKHDNRCKELMNSIDKRLKEK